MGRTRRIALAIVLLPLAWVSSPRAVAQVPDSTLHAPCVGWSVSALPPKLARRIHKRAKDVPAYPHEDPSLNDPATWPGTARIGGAQCSLRVEELGRNRISRARSLDEVAPKNGVALWYESAPWKGWGSRRGPYYCCYSLGSKRWVHDRSWMNPGAHKSTGIYIYYTSGELYLYEREGLDEVFDRNGCLVACNASGSCYYLGRRASPHEFNLRVSELLR